MLNLNLPIDRVLKVAGMPAPTPLRRYEPGAPLLTAPALLGGAPGGRLLKSVEKIVKDAGATPLKKAPDAEDQKLGALIFDATGITSSAQLIPRLKILLSRTLVVGWYV